MRDLLLPVIAVLAVTGNAFAEIHEIPTKCPESSGKTVQLAHKHDCTKYYECSNGEKLLSNCPEFAPGQKLHFDPELQNCTFPWEANCASRAPDCSKDEFIQPHPTNCSLYYKCENGEKVLKTCGEEQLFCSDSLECVHKDAAKCKVYDSCPTGKLLEAVLLPHDCNRQSLYYECVDGQYDVRRCPSGHEFDAERRQCVSNVPCPVTGTKRISHETDCGLFYECVDGVKVEKVCEDGLSFDETKGICTWPRRHECSSNFNQTDLATYFLPHVAEEKDVLDCPSVGYTFVHHECSCTKYYYCEEGNKILAICPNGMIYDYIRKVCDLPDAAVCWNQKYTQDSYLYENCYNSPDCPPTGYRRSGIGMCSERYYDCTDGVKCDRSCGEGLVFNSGKQQCDIPENVGGCNGDQPTTTTTTTTTTSRPTTTWRAPYCIEGNQMPHECNCYAYYVCRNGEYQWMKCPPGEKFDWAEKKCMSQNIAECRPSGHNGCQGSCSSSSDLLPHRECNKYCTCDHGTITVRTCPSHTYYDRYRQICNWPEDIRDSDLPAHCDPTDCSFGNNYVPHDCYCDLYYECSGNGKFLQRCRIGEYFDYAEEKCVDNVAVGTCISSNVPAFCTTIQYRENVAQNVNLSSNCPSLTDCSSNIGIVPRYCKCTLCYECDGRFKYYEVCDTGLKFDFVLGSCMSKNAHCCYCNLVANETIWLDIPFVNNFL
ncbi:chitin-binding domain protein cbd-1-like [Bombus flavifrons]|uniref:chitin-binding domain protein cbd-1-like n=1 Tax=Bombus flavifrons TaxID=103934 RepID=UPI003703C74A